MGAHSSYFPGTYFLCTCASSIKGTLQMLLIMMMNAKTAVYTQVGVTDTSKIMVMTTTMTVTMVDDMSWRWPLFADRMTLTASSRHDTRRRNQTSEDQTINRVFRPPWPRRHRRLPGRLWQVSASERHGIPKHQTERHLPVLVEDIGLLRSKH